MHSCSTCAADCTHVRTRAYVRSPDPAKPSDTSLTLGRCGSHLRCSSCSAVGSDRWSRLCPSPSDDDCYFGGACLGRSVGGCMPARRSKRALRMRHAWNRRAAPRDPMEFLVPSWLLNLFVRRTFRRLSAHLFGPPNPKKTGFSFRVCYPTACLGFDGSRIGCPLSLSLARPLSIWTMISSESSHHWIHARAVMIRLRCSASVNRAGDHCSSLLQHWPLAIWRHHRSSRCWPCTLRSSNVA